MPQFSVNHAVSTIGKLILGGGLIKNGNKCPVLIGETGIGKSTALKDWARTNGYGYVSIWLNGMEDNGDLLGRPIVDAESGKTKFAVPSFMPEEERDGQVGIIVLEEINSIPSHLVENLKCFISERRLGDYTLPLGWVMVGTANPTSEDVNFKTDAYHTYDHDAAIRARLIEIPVKTTMDDWMDYVYSTGEDIHPDLAGVLMVHASEGIFSLASPRQFSALNTLLNETIGLTKNEALVVVEGVIKKPEFTRMFMAFMKSGRENRPLTINDFLDKPDESMKKYREKVESTNHPFIFFTFKNISMHISKMGHDIPMEVFRTYQMVAHETPQDMLIPGLSIACSNKKYVDLFSSHDEDFFMSLKEHKDSIMSMRDKAGYARLQ